VWQPWRMRLLPAATLTAAAIGAAGLGYAGGYEVRAFTLREVDIPVLRPGSAPLRVLHLSDLHLTPSQHKKQRWLRELAQLQPDLVVNTGDNLAHPRSVPAVLQALDGLLDRPGVFVFGSNDYFAPIWKNPARYLQSGRRDIRRLGPRLPWRDLRDAFTARGWVDLDNARASVEAGGRRLAFAGVDDPHLGYDQLGAVAGPADPDADLAIGVAHAPYLRVLDAFRADGYPLIFAGHTHGGQLCLPGKGALVTNCDLDTARAKGLHRHPAGDPSGAWLHVSAGLGTSPTAPVRFCCRPEATLVTLRPK
jgi:predicted MPP superfamily phosphohydrolase